MSSLPLVVDLHNDLLYDATRRRVFQAERNVLETYHLPGLRQANVRIQVLPIYFRGLYLPESALRQTILTVNTFLQEIDESAGNFVLIKTKQELEAAWQEDKIGVILAMEGADGLGRDIELVRMFFELGLRMLGLTWNRANSLAEGCGEDTGAGLTMLGRELVKNLADYPVILDVSHLSEASFWDALKHCQGPILASHSNSAVVCPHYRNLTDDQLTALAERGGIIGLNFYPEFVSTEEALLPGLIRHVEHIANLVGLEHVALGPDFIDYLPATLLPGEVVSSGGAITLPGVSMLADFYSALRAHGFLEEEAALIMGKNALRFLAGALPV